MNRRCRLWMESPNCYWCGRETVLATPLPGFGPGTPLLATVDHVITRREKDRRAKLAATGATLHVLACFECNHERGSTPFAQFRPRKKSVPGKGRKYRREIAA
jgi:hypothetical protein